MVPLAAIFFCASFNVTLLKNLCESLVVTTGGAEVLPFLASYCVLPASLLFFTYYAQLCSMVPSRSVFYLALLPLLAGYVLFATVLFPAAPQLHFTGLAASMGSFLPAGLTGAVKVVENWTFSLFFCSAELWGTVVISVLFWTLANDVFSVSEAKTAYPLMGMSGNVAMVTAGNYIKWVNCGPAAATGISASLRWLVGSVIATSVVMCCIKRFIDVKGYYTAKESNPSKPKKGRKKTGSLRESLEVLRSNRKIGNLAVLVIGYGVCHRLFEFAWKGQLRVMFPETQAYQAALSDVSIATGVTTAVLMILGQYVFKYAGWRTAAAATPVALLGMGIGFFGLSLASTLGLAPFGLAPAALAMAGVAAGSVTQVCARSFKFSLFDPAKEMVYIEMTKEEKSQGKAAVDLVGSQIGKSGASWITQALLLSVGSISAALPFTSIIYTLVLVCWLKAVSSLNTDLQDQAAAENQEKAGASTGLSQQLMAGGDSRHAVNIATQAASTNGRPVNGEAAAMGIATVTPVVEVLPLSAFDSLAGRSSAPVC